MNDLLNWIYSNILLIRDCLLWNIIRYQDVWSPFFYKYNTLDFVIPGNKIENLSWRIKNLTFPLNSILSCIFILCGKTNMNHDSPEEIAIGLISSGTGTMSSCQSCNHSITPRDKMVSLRRENIKIINLLLKSECPKHILYTYNHKKDCLNADWSLNESSFYSDYSHLVKEGNKPLAK